MLEVVEELFLDDINVPKWFLESIPNQVKYNRHLEYYLKHKDIAKELVVGTNGTLKDGYIDYLILKSFNVDKFRCYISDKKISAKKKKTRRSVWEKTGGKCVGCGKNLKLSGKQNSENYMTIDHIVPLVKGGSSKLENLQPMCHNCNEKKSDIIGYYDNELR
jgi:hypothetical protein